MTQCSTTVVLDHDPRSVGQARAVVGEVTAELAALSREDAVLLTSELVTNALRHGGPHIELSTILSEGSVIVSVFDDGADLPVLDDAAPPMESLSGRGLLMVHSVAQDWGVRIEASRPGKTVWFELGHDGVRAE